MDSLSDDCLRVVINRMTGHSQNVSHRTGGRMSYLTRDVTKKTLAVMDQIEMTDGLWYFRKNRETRVTRSMMGPANRRGIHLWQYLLEQHGDFSGVIHVSNSGGYIHFIGTFRSTRHSTTTSPSWTQCSASAGNIGTAV